ncbi:MAG: PAS domain-containing protein [Deltaproteobacteria bacterium]|nr:PAS domain-containing protein [Deltaproteobacteria bacterium]
MIGGETVEVMEQGYDPIGEANERLRDALAQLKHARQVQKVFMGLGKELSLGAGQEEILSMIVDSVRALFPDVHYLVQLADPKTHMPTLVDFRGPIHPGAAGRIHLSRRALVKTRLDPAIEQAHYVEVIEEPPALFESSTHAIHVPLVADNQLFGAIQLEGHADAPLDDDDEMLLISLANQLAMAIRNQRLLDETAYLKDYMASVLEQANALIVVTDMNRQILVFNQAMERLLGFPKEQVLARDLFMWIPGDEQDRFAEEISKTIAGEASPAGVETRMRNRDGQLVQMVFSLATLRDRAGEIDSLILVGQDMTQVRALEKQVIEAEKMATLGKLAAGVVHELNNPLTSISVYSEYLMKKMHGGLGDESDAEKMGKIMEGAQRIQKLTRDLVSYGRPSAEEPEPIAFNDLVAQGLSFCEHTIRKHDVRVIQDLAPNIPMLVANRSQILQLLINLITNSCQSMEGGGELTVATSIAKPDVVGVSISDTGSGIPERDLERIFEPFYTTKSAGKGTGLGLSIVRRIVEHHRGRISVTSTQGVGSCFQVELPLSASKIERMDAPAREGKTG